MLGSSASDPDRTLGRTVDRYGATHTLHAPQPPAPRSTSHHAAGGTRSRAHAEARGLCGAHAGRKAALAVPQRSRDAVFWQQRDLRLDINYRIGLERESVFLSDHGKHDRRLDVGEMTADAHSLSPAERIVGEPRQPFLQSILPAFGGEPLRLWEIPGVAVVHPLVH